MKKSKLKFLFAFIALALVATVGALTLRPATVSTTTSDVKTTLSGGEITPADDPTDTPTEATLVYLFNSGYSTSVSPLGGAFNPAYSYALQDTASGTYSKVYALNYESTAVNREGVNVGGTLSSANADNVGLGLAFGLNSLSSSAASDQENLDATTKARSFATQMYIWIANNGYLGTSTETAIVNANLTGSALSTYNYIKNSVNQVSANPSYTYSTQAQANANAIEMNWNAQNSRYEYTVTDTNGLDTMSLVNLIIQTNSGIQYSKNGNSVVFYTNEQVGSKDNPASVTVYKTINSGRYIPETATTKENGQTLVYLSSRQKGMTASYVSFYTNALRINMTKSLGTANGNGNTRTGDVKVQNAVYGIYSDSSCSNLVQEIVTGADGVATSNPLEFRDYYVKEITAPEGSDIDTNVYTASASAATTNSNGQKVINLTSTNQVIYGGFRMIVSTSDLSGNTTKEPSVGSKLKLTLDSNPSEYYETTVDEHGYADFTNIPYGHYTCTETQKSREDLDSMDPMSIFINSKQTYIYSKIVNDEVTQRYVRIEKRDVETGKLIPVANTEFEVKDSSGNPVVQWVIYPEEQTLTTYKTDDEGYLVMPEKLPYGTYTVSELNAPTGYYNESLTEGKVSATFTISEEEVAKDTEKVVVVNDIAQKANLNLTVRGEILTGTYDQESNGYEIKAPAYGSAPIAGAVYKVTAKEDITTADGTVRMKQGDSVTLTTDANGAATTKLYLGNYTIEAVSVPEGYVLNTTPEDVTLTYRGQKVKEFTQPVTKSLIKQDYKVNLTKEFQGSNYFTKYMIDNNVTSSGNFSDVYVGIYAAEDIKDVNGQTKIAKDTLVDVVRFNDDGTANVNVSLPSGKFYAKELYTDENYELSTDKYEINAVPQNATEQLFTIDVEKIVNVLKNENVVDVTKLEGDTEDDDASSWHKQLSAMSLMAKVAGALEGGISKSSEPKYLAGAKYGVYYISGYEKDANGYYDYDKPIFEPLYEKVNGEYAEVVRTTDENGKFKIAAVPYYSLTSDGERTIDRLYLKEIEAPKYYDANDKYIPVDFDDTVKLHDVRTLVDVTTTIKDEEGTLVKDATVTLVDTEDENVTYTAVTDENGVAKFAGIRAGKYTRTVSDYDEKYVTIDPVEVEYTEDTEVEIDPEIIKGNILVYKTDSETGLPLAGCSFKITDENGETVAEGQSDEEGHFLAQNLKYGVYYVEETAAPENYEKDDTVYEVTIKVNGETLEVDFANVPTGDIAVGMFAAIAAISVVAIYVTTKKLRKN